jgi:hypothetical protein
MATLQLTDVVSAAASPIRTQWRMHALVALALVVLSARVSTQEIPVINTATVVGTAVTIAGENLSGVTRVTVGGETLANVSVNGDGTQVSGSLAVPLTPGTYVLELSAAVSIDANCASVRPAAGWVCVDGGWLPPTHPLAARAGTRIVTIEVSVTPGGGGAGTSAIFASVYSTANHVIDSDAAVPFTHAASASRATLSGSEIRLGGSGTMQSFLIAWSVSMWSVSCTFAVTVNGVPEQALKFGFGNIVGPPGGQGIVTIPDNAVLTLRNLSGASCELRAVGPGGGGNSTFLTVLKVG